MSRVYLHSNNHENSLNKLMIYLFIPFIVYGFYKNGIKLYSADYISLLEMFKPLLFVGLSVLTTIIFSKLNEETFMGYRLISNLMISIVVSPNLNVFIYLAIIAILNFLLKFMKFNIVPIFMIINIVLSYIFKSNAFLNVYEADVVHSYSALDLFLGKGYGGVSNTLLIMSIISLVILILNINYKKQIPIMAFITFYGLMMIYSFASGNASANLLLNNNVIFAFIFVSNISIYTPYSKGACYIYGLLLGVLTFAFSFIDINIGVYIVIAILGFISKILDCFIVGKTNTNLVEVL